MDINDIFEDGEDLQDNNKPSLEDIKKIVDNKRLKASNVRTPSKTYTKEERIKNLELARDKKRNIEKKPIAIPEPKQEPIKSKTISENKSVENLNTSIPIINHTFNNENNIINELKQIIITQNEILEKLKIDTKPKKIRKPKSEIKTNMKSLDLTITDDDIKKIIENNNNNSNSNSNSNSKKTIEPKNDEKLPTFIDALLKK